VVAATAAVAVAVDMVVAAALVAVAPYPAWPVAVDPLKLWALHDRDTNTTLQAHLCLSNLHKVAEAAVLQRRPQRAATVTTSAQLRTILRDRALAVERLPEVVAEAAAWEEEAILSKDWAKNQNSTTAQTERKRRKHHNQWWLTRLKHKIYRYRMTNLPIASQAVNLASV